MPGCSHCSHHKDYRPPFLNTSRSEFSFNQVCFFYWLIFKDILTYIKELSLLFQWNMLPIFERMELKECLCIYIYVCMCECVCIRDVAIVTSNKVVYCFFILIKTMSNFIIIIKLTLYYNVNSVFEPSNLCWIKLIYFRLF